MVSIRRTGVSIKHIFAHLCKADFHLADEEAAFIADNLVLPFTTEEMNRYIRTHHTENPDFAKKIPSSFKRLVDFDRAQAAESSPLSRRSLGEGGADTRPILLPAFPNSTLTAVK